MSCEALGLQVGIFVEDVSLAASSVVVRQGLPTESSQLPVTLLAA